MVGSHTRMRWLVYTQANNGVFHFFSVSQFLCYHISVILTIGRGATVRGIEVRRKKRTKPK